MTEILTPQASGGRIGDYIIEAEVGRGGMGVVYRAHKADTGEVVALKLMLPELVANPEFRERFVREAELGPNLDHPNIVPIFDSGEADGRLFIAMRLVDGRDLKELIKEEGPLEPARAVRIFHQAAAALDCAHEAGVVHLDVKPQNILVAHDDEIDGDLVYISDFGLVRPVGSESHASRTGQILGSIQYMSPEVVEGQAADGRADVYSLGCVLYEALTGKIPFDRPNEVAVLWAHVHEDPPRVTDARPHLPGGLDGVVGTALAKHPDDRFLTCGELALELEKGIGRKHRPVVMPLVRPLVKRAPRRKTEREVWGPNYFPELSRVRKLTDKTNWLQVTAVASILCLLAAALVHFAHPRGIGGAASDAAFAVGDSVLWAGGKLAAALPLDAREQVSQPKTLASESKQDRSSTANGPNISIRRPRGTTDEGSASRSYVAAGDADTRPTSVEARENEIVFDSPGAGYEGYSSLFTMRPDGSRVRLLYNSPEEDRDPSWSPDGRRIAFVRGGALFVMDADGSDVRQLAFGAGSSRDPSWSPDGTKIVYAHSLPGADPDWDLYTVPASGSVNLGERLTSGDTDDLDPDWSPEGSRIAFTRRASRTGTDRVHLVNADGSDLTRLGDGTSGTRQPAWSPDASRLAYITDALGGAIRIYDMRTGRVRNLMCPGCTHPEWSRDAGRLVYNASERGSWSLYILALSEPDVRNRIARYVGEDVGADWKVSR